MSEESASVKSITSETFQENLKVAASRELQGLQDEIANAIAAVLKTRNLAQFRMISLTYFGQDHYNSKATVQFTDKPLIQQLEEYYNNKKLSDFQAALNNFAWAIQNGSGQ